MNLEMKSIKHSNFASQETYCYQAVVYLDGKPFADVSNDGHGGCDYVHPHDKSPLIKVKGAWNKKYQEIEEISNHYPTLTLASTIICQKVCLRVLNCGVVSK